MIYSTGNNKDKNFKVMRVRLLRLFLLFICLSTYISVFSQENRDTTKSVISILDSLRKSGIVFNDDQNKPEIVLTISESVKLLQQRFQSQNWNDNGNAFRQALGQLIFEASNPPYDSSEYILKNYPYDSLSIPWKNFYIWEPLRIKIPFISNPDFRMQADTTILADTSHIPDVSDTLKIKLSSKQEPALALKQVTGLKDTTIMVVIDTLSEVTGSFTGFPFKYLSYPYQSDSIKVAVKNLLKYIEDRDSTIVNFTGVGNSKVPVWMNSKAETMMRYWLKNEFSDSVTIWIGSPARNTMSLFLEQGVNFRRPVKQGNYADAKINIQSIDNSKLMNVQKINVKSQLWKYRTEAAFILNQASLTNWVRGGESSISTALDITGYADYNNPALKLSSSNFARIKLGFLQTGHDPIRKNLDLIETNSKLNHKAFGLFDFSGILLFKTQLAEGKNYFKRVNNSDSVDIVSKFMNPAILTIGFGLDYKPNPKTSINFSPLSYKGTFVTDTAMIDQTKYGIAADKRSLNEPGVSFMISNEFNPVKSVTIVNRLQLFTNYIHNPQNIDIDWEMIAVANLNWFTDVRLNTHLIFDDDTKTVKLDRDGNAISRKTARAQFKEMLGFSLVFRF
jgi:hypothetical protein